MSLGLARSRKENFTDTPKVSFPDSSTSDGEHHPVSSESAAEPSLDSILDRIMKARRNDLKKRRIRYDRQKLPLRPPVRNYRPFQFALGGYFLLCVLLGGLELRRRHHGFTFPFSRNKERKQYLGNSLVGADDWLLGLFGNQSGYFVDVGAFQMLGFSNTRKLEAKGWKGVCADPMMRDVANRQCGYMPRPITGRNDEIITAPKGTEKCQGHFNTTDNYRDTCARERVTSVSISDFLAFVDAPQVIDYLSVSARGFGPSILEGFPWDRYCVRYWTFEVKHKDFVLPSVEEIDETDFDYSSVFAADENEVKTIRSSLGKHRCRSTSKGADVWAACLCPGDVLSPSPQQQSNITVHDSPAAMTTD